MRRRNPGEMFAALVLIFFGLLFLAGNLGLFTLGWNIIWPAFLILLGVWLVGRAFSPSARYSRQGASSGFGDYVPNLAGKELRDVSFSHGFGDFDLDLTRAVIPEGESVVRASHGFGDLTIIVPRDIPARIQASVGFGDVIVFDQHSSGIGSHLEIQSDDYATATRKLFVDASAGFGDVKVLRAG